MICLSALIHLPLRAIAIIALIIIFGHNLLDTIPDSRFGAEAPLWDLLHVQNDVKYNGDSDLFVLYPIIPWPGVMAIGYCFGSILKKEAQQRNKYLFGIGFSTIILFIVLRFSNWYGDPFPWQPQSNTTNTILSFIKCQKYPPSLLYLLMTIGPAIAAMPLLEKMRGIIGKFFTVYGRVPMFYYILHIYLIHILALLIGLWLQAGVMPGVIGAQDAVAQKGLSLRYVYLVWAIVIALLYYPCRWFMRIKALHKKWWLSYI